MTVDARLTKVKKMPRFICFVGTDGAGKTTLARAFNTKQMQAHQLEYQYFDGGAYYTYILGSIRKLVSKSKSKQKNIFQDTEKHKAKKEAPTKSKSLRRLSYAGFLLIDYALLVFIKVKLPLLKDYKITSARYVYDVAIKFKILLHLDDAQTHTIIRRFTRILPNPDYVFLIDIPEEVALKRKDDIPSLSYLTERRQLYQQIMQPYATAVLDGRRSVTELLAEVEKYINAG